LLLQNTFIRLSKHPLQLFDQFGYGLYHSKPLKVYIT